MTTDITTRQRFSAMKERDRSRWLDPAEVEFAAQGFENASLNRILAQAGVSKGRSYHYFADKGEVFRAALERRLAQVDGLDDAAALGAADRQKFWIEIAAMCAELTAAFQRDQKLAALVRTLHREAAAQAAFGDPLAQLRSRIERLLAVGQSLNAVRSDLPLSLLGDVALDMVVTVDRWFAQNATTLTHNDEQILSKRAFSLLMAPLLPPVSTKDSRS